MASTSKGKGGSGQGERQKIHTWRNRLWTVEGKSCGKGRSWVTTTVDDAVASLPCEIRCKVPLTLWAGSLLCTQVSLWNPRNESTNPCRQMGFKRGEKIWRRGKDSEVLCEIPWATPAQYFWFYSVCQATHPFLNTNPLFISTSCNLLYHQNQAWRSLGSSTLNIIHVQCFFTWLAPSIEQRVNQKGCGGTGESLAYRHTAHPFNFFVIQVLYSGLLHAFLLEPKQETNRTFLLETIAHPICTKLADKMQALLRTFRGDQDRNPYTENPRQRTCWFRLSLSVGKEPVNHPLPMELKFNIWNEHFFEHIKE